ncbi:hypothetical protein HYS49_01240 [Candidatus Woesearchaeota archaeon]|nr:hypothetical protein [Candidatus Woesearchaeota archaeon]
MKIIGGGEAWKMNKKRLLTLFKRTPSESIGTALASEEVLREEWNNKMDERWNSV